MGTVRDKYERDRAVLSEENKKLAAEKERVMDGSGRFGRRDFHPWMLEFVFKYFYFK